LYPHFYGDIKHINHKYQYFRERIEIGISGVTVGVFKKFNMIFCMDLSIGYFYHNSFISKTYCYDKKF